MTGEDVATPDCLTSTSCYVPLKGATLHATLSSLPILPDRDFVAASYLVAASFEQAAADLDRAITVRIESVEMRISPLAGLQLECEFSQD